MKTMFLRLRNARAKRDSLMAKMQRHSLIVSRLTRQLQTAQRELEALQLATENEKRVRERMEEQP